MSAASDAGGPRVTMAQQPEAGGPGSVWLVPAVGTEDVGPGAGGAEPRETPILDPPDRSRLVSACGLGDDI